MAQSNPFVSSCSRRQLARRRAHRVRRGWYPVVLPGLLLIVSLVAGGMAFIAGRGGL